MLTGFLFHFGRLFRSYCGSHSAAQELSADQMKGLSWRLIGPHRGGRVTAVAGIAGDPKTYYMGTPGGGVWKTNNGGVTLGSDFRRRACCIDRGPGRSRRRIATSFMSQPENSLPETASGNPQTPAPPGRTSGFANRGQFPPSLWTRRMPTLSMSPRWAMLYAKRLPRHLQNHGWWQILA